MRVGYLFLPFSWVFLSKSRVFFLLLCLPFHSTQDKEEASVYMVKRHLNTEANVKINRILSIVMLPINGTRTRQEISFTRSNLRRENIFEIKQENAMNKIFCKNKELLRINILLLPSGKFSFFGFLLHKKMFFWWKLNERPLNVQLNLISEIKFSLNPRSDRKQSWGGSSPQTFSFPQSFLDCMIALSFPAKQKESNEQIRKLVYAIVIAIVRSRRRKISLKMTYTCAHIRMNIWCIPKYPSQKSTEPTFCGKKRWKSHRSRYKKNHNSNVALF